MAAIQAIDRSSIHKITSGQVVVDLQTAVKELVENSIDAGATSIDVRFKDYGLKSFEVIDNGSGISPENYDSVALKHHTSKLASFDELSSVRTFGFRGEALASLCALSESVVITTATNTESIGTILELDRNGSVKNAPSKVARQRGTTVIINNIFNGLPVRRTELSRNIRREFAKVLALLNAYALYPCATENNGIRLTVSNLVEGGKKSVQIRTTGSTMLSTCVTSLWGPKSTDDIVALELSVPVEPEKSYAKRQQNSPKIAVEVSIKGLISKFAHGKGRASSDRQFFYVNGRPCTLTKVQKTFNEVYKTFNTNQYPFVIANLSLPTDAYDVNVSPDKRTIFLHNEGSLLFALKASLESAFSSARATFDVASTQTGSNICSQKPRAFAKESGQRTLGPERIIEEDTGDDPLVEEFKAATSPLPKHSSMHRTHLDLKSSSSEYAQDETIETDDKIYSTLRIDDTSERLPKRKRSPSITVLSPPSKNIHRFSSTLTLPAHASSLREISTNSGLLSTSKTISSSPSSTNSGHTSPLPTSGQDTLSIVQTPEPRSQPSRVFAKPDSQTKPSPPVSSTFGQQFQTVVDGKRKHEEGILDGDDQHPVLDDGRIDEMDAPLDTEQITTSASVEIVRSSGTRTETLSTDFESIRRLWDARASAPFPQEYLSLPRSTDQDSNMALENAGLSTLADDEAARALSRVIRKEDFADGAMSVVGQFNLGFIIARLNRRLQSEDESTFVGYTDDLFIIDQHAADEKYNFETLQQTTKIQSQGLLRPRPLEFSASDELVAVDNLAILKSNGFEVSVSEEEPVGRRLHLTAQPQSKGTIFDMHDLEELLNLMRDQPPGNMVRCTKARNMFASRACRKSTMVGKPLTRSQMTAIVRHMETMDQPWSCPHGRPTMRHLTNLREIIPHPRPKARKIAWANIAAEGL